MQSEKRLIDANALIAEYDRVHIGPPGGARKLMEDAPTVDAVEVVHGRWFEDTATDMIVCTECVHAWNIIDNCTETFNYCPNCGAKMDADDLEE